MIISDNEAVNSVDKYSMTKKPDDESNVLVVEHLLISDGDSKKVILNKRQTIDKDKRA